MAISRKFRQENEKTENEKTENGNRKSGKRENGKLRAVLSSLLPVFLSACLSLFVLTSACASVRPIYKIGLIAPFEGLYRRNGYEALAAMRSAIADASPNTIDLLPLALDESIDVQRSAGKLLQDPLVKAVVGPLNPDAWRLVTPALTGSQLPWVVPFAIVPDVGFVDPASDLRWVSELIRAAATSLPEQGKKRLLLAGGHEDVLLLDIVNSANVSKNVGAEVQLFDSLQDVQAEDALFWLGSPAEGAKFVDSVWQITPNVLVWTGAQGGDPIFQEHLADKGTYFWAVWSNLQYADWAKNHQPASPNGFLVYHATARLVAELLAQPDPMQDAHWFVQCFQANDDLSTTTLQNCNLAGIRL